ncbi:MAG: glycoside hydrolase [Bryobacteraceae bacterium]|nr:glycoside hydrolase [Bryobacteraceae bacterium]MDW8378021.1 sialidase family protein [Bryobacterales bacterium]
MILTLAWALLAAVAQTQTVDRHVTIYRETGRFGGWPANHGIWSWGEEIVVGFSAAWYQKKDANRHQMDSSKPEQPRLARSRDGGLSWVVEAPSSLLPPEQGGKPAQTLQSALPFADPNFAMTLRFKNIHQGSSYLYYSTDRGKNWQGPYDFPLFGQSGVAARTDYIVEGPRECSVFLTAAKSNGREGRVFLARTRDGGLNWRFVAWIGPEPEGFSIMPSSVRLGPRKLLTATRVKLDQTRSWIELFESEDDGASWKPAGRVADTGSFSGNPPSLIRLQDGRLCLTYARRDPPFPIAAKLSADNGKTWSQEMILRADAAAWDMGYVRSVERPDGKIVTVYYYNDQVAPERFIAATIWKP